MDEGTDASLDCHPASMMPLIGNRCRRMRWNKIRNGLRTRACRYIDGNKIIPYYVISTLVRFPAFSPSSRLLPQRVWRQQSEKLRKDTDWLRLQPLSYLTIFSSLFSLSPHVLLESSSVRLECSRKYSRVRPIRRRENLTLLSGFLHLFPRRSSISADWPTLSLSDLDVQRTYGLRPWNVPSSRSSPPMIFRSLLFQYLFTEPRFSNKRDYKCVQLILILTRHVL